MRVVQVGLGNQGRKRSAVAGADLVATVDPVNPEARHKCLDDVPLDSFDAAIVSTPDAPKLEFLRYLIRHGKHVLVEKPLLARDPQQIVALADLAAATGAVWYTGYNHRFEPQIKALKALMQSGTLGPVYTVRLFYGNGTARDVHASWRDGDLGVLTDLGSHLIDLTGFLLGSTRRSFVPWSLRRFENHTFDHVVLGSPDLPPVQLEASYLSWRNTFTIDVLCGLGSAHIRGLCKWGPSTLLVRKRVFPSGLPSEHVETVDTTDPTWAEEYTYFKELCRGGPSSFENDLWINSTLLEVAGGLQAMSRHV